MAPIERKSTEEETRAHFENYAFDSGPDISEEDIYLATHAY